MELQEIFSSLNCFSFSMNQCDLKYLESLVICQSYKTNNLIKMHNK